MVYGLKKYMLAVVIAIILCLDLILNTSGLPVFWRMFMHVLAILLSVIWIVKTKMAYINQYYVMWVFLFAFIIISILRSDSFSVYQAIQWSIIASFFIFYEVDQTEYRIAVYIIVIFSVFQCVGVLMELFLPKMWLPIYLAMSKNQFTDRQYQIAYARSVIKSGYLTGFSYNPGYTAIYIVNGIAATFSLKENKRRILILLIFQLICLFITGKRAHALFILFALAMTSVITGGSFSRRMLKIAGLLGTFVALYYVGYYIFFYTDVKTRIIRLLKFIYTNERFDLGNKGRAYLWRNALREFSGNKLFGIGWGVFGDKYGAEVHNTYLQVFCEAGVIAGICFIVAVVMTVIFIAGTYSRYRGVINNNTLLKQVSITTIVYVIFYILESAVSNTLWGCDQFFMFFLLLKSYSDIVVNSVKGALYEG